MNEDQREAVIPLIAETVDVDTETVPTGGVRVIKRVVTDSQVVDHHLRSSTVNVKRIPMNKVVDSPSQPIIQTDDLVIIPVVQEVLKIERQWVVTEEIHLVRTQQTSHHSETVDLKREVASIEKISPT